MCARTDTVFTNGHRAASPRHGSAFAVFSQRLVEHGWFAVPFFAWRLGFVAVIAGVFVAFFFLNTFPTTITPSERTQPRRL